MLALPCLVPGVFSEALSFRVVQRSLPWRVEHTLVRISGKGEAPRFAVEPMPVR
jgi:hypothetical protein